MKTTMKKLAACLLALLLVLQIVSAYADVVISKEQGPINPDLYRDKLEVRAGTSILTAGMETQLTATEGYNKLAWSSDNESVATVDGTGKVTAVSAGQVRITANEGSFSDSVTLKVIGTAGSEENAQGSEKMVILISGSKEKVTYDGQPHTTAYTATSNNEDFDESKLILTDPSLLASGTDCNVYQDKLTAEAFQYEGGDAEFVVSNGWLQIKPASVTIKANDAAMVEGDPEPAFTATVTSSLEGVDLSGITYTMTTYTDGGITYILPECESIQGNYRITAQAGVLTVISMVEHPLYNLAQVNNGDWYRLSKGTIETTFTDITKNFGTVKAADYRVEPYVFDDLVITIKGKEYVYQCAKNQEKIVRENANYYTVSLKNVEVVKNKIGGMNGSTPRWLVPEDERYTDKNEIDSIHRNFNITTYENKLQTEEQDVYNMLSVNGSSNYHRLKKTRIVAQAYDQAKSPLKSGEYILAPYDFTNVKLVINGEEYTYSDHIITDEYYENYYTVEFENLVKESLINKNANWFKNEDGWLDGAKETYGDIPNNTPGFHANYKAKTYKGNPEPEDTLDLSNMKITLESDWPEGEPGYVGAKITFTARLTGFEGKTYTLQWQYSTDHENWIDIPDAHEDSYTCELSLVNAKYYWRAIALDVKEQQ